MGLGSILAAVGVLAVVIFVHELGHFLSAKWCDVEVKTFSMGFGPTVFARTYGETEYRLAAIPLGGYVRMAGQDDDDSGGAPEDDSRGFSAKTIAQRALIIGAGPAVNFVFAGIIFFAIALAYGKTVPSDRAVIGSMQPETPAAVSELKAGDEVLSVDGAAVANWDEFAQSVADSGGKTLTLLVVGDDGAERSVAVTPGLQMRRDYFGEAVGEGYMLGVGRTVESVPVSFVGAVETGITSTWRFSWMILATLGRVLQGRLAATDLGGPIFIAQVASEQAKHGLEPLLAFLALISVNLGVINILPVPVLDGGHLVFLGMEALRGKPLSLRFRERALQAGMGLLGLLMLFVVCNDIVRIVSG